MGKNKRQSPNKKSIFRITLTSKGKFEISGTRYLACAWRNVADTLYGNDLEDRGKASDQRAQLLFERADLVKNEKRRFWAVLSS